MMFNLLESYGPIAQIYLMRVILTIIGVYIFLYYSWRKEETLCFMKSL